MNFITKRIRQIFFMNRVQKRVISALLTICMVFSFMQMPGFSYSAKADNSALTSTVTRITLNGSELTDDTVVKNGDVLKIEFDWAISNTDKSTKEFTVDLTALQNSNIAISTSGQNELKDDAGNVVGYYQVVEGGQLQIVIQDTKFLNKDGRKGGVVIEGKVAVDDTDLEDGDPVTIGLGTKVYYPTYDTGIATSGIWANKSADGGAYKTAGGDFAQDFKMSVSAYSGEVTLTGIADTPGAALGNPTNIQISTSNAAEITTQTFASMSDLNAYLAGKKMAANESFEITYTQTVDHASTGSTENKASVTYTNNKDDEVTANTSAWAQLQDPSIDKAGALSADGSKVDWTITVNLGDYAIGDPAIADVVASIKDTPGSGLTDTSVQDILSKMEPQGNGVYTYTFSSEITDAYKNASSQVTVSNTVEMTMKDGTVKTDTASVTITPSDWIKKSVAGYDEATKVITWDVVLNPIPQGVTDIVISDAAGSPWVSNYGNHSVNWEVMVDGVQVIDENGKKTTAFDNYLEGYDEWNRAQKIQLSDTYVAQKYKQSITVTFKTTVTDDSLMGKAYTNTANVSYLDPSLQTTQTKNAVAQYQDVGDLLEKTGTAVSGKNSIRYKVSMYLYGVDLEPGKDIVVTEQFPDGMIYGSNPDLKAVVENPWGNTAYNCSVNYDGVNKFTVQLTDEIINAITSDYPYLTLYYTLDVEDEGEFSMNGTQEFTNRASATYDGTSIGGDTSTVSLTPQKIVTKTGNYSIVTAPYAEYEVDINDEALDLLPGAGTLTATDTLGSALSYDISSIKVSKYEGNTWVEMADTEYKYSYDVNNNSLTFSGLPDETWLRINYRARVNVAYGSELTEENSTNHFSLSGTSSEAVKASKGFSVVAVKPDGWATSEEGQIELYKFWTDDGQMVALPSSVFKLVKVKYDEASNSMIEDPGKEGDVDYNKGSAVLQDDITVGEDGTVTITGLSYARIYALYETAAPEGYAVNTEPYYFVLSGTSATLPPEESGIKVSVFSTGSQLLYENQKAAAGTLEVTKSFAGVEDADIASALANVSFTVQKDGVTISGGSFTGTNMTLTDGVYKKTFTNLPTGTYTVKETMLTLDGYIYKTSTYTIYDVNGGTSAPYTMGSTVNVTVPDGTATTAFENTYAKKASLVIEKTVSGDANWDDVKDSVVFEVYDKTDMSTPVATVNGSDLVADGTTYRKEITGLDPSKTYVVKESGAVLGGYTKTTTYQIGTTVSTGSTDDEVTTSDITLAAGGSETVTFNNDYDVHTGTLKITKQATFDISDKNWDDVKSNLTFTVKSKETGAVVCTITGDDLVENATSGLYEYTLPDALPIGTYIVTETVTDIAGMIVSTEYTVTTATGTQTEVGRVASPQITKDDEAVVAYVNNYKTKYATLLVKKTVTGDVSWDDIKDKITFTVEGPSNTWTIRGTDAGFTKTGDNTYTYAIENIDVAGAYTITETFSSEDTDNYTRTTTVKVDNAAAQTGESVTIDFEIPEGATVEFTNDYEHNTGNLVLKKTIGGVADADLSAAEEKITFVVTPSPVDNEANKVYKLSDFNKNLDGTYTLAISGVPTGDYHVKETVYDLNGYDTQSVEYSLTTANGSTSNISGAKVNGADVTVATDRSTTVDVTDEYKKYTANLELAKEVTGDLGWDAVKDNLSFRVTNAETGYDETFTYEDFADADGNGVYVCKITDLPLGTYVVTEILTDEAGYVTTTTYQVGTGNATIGKEGSVTLTTKGQTAHIAFVNEYDKLTGSILLKKSVAGDQTWSHVRDTLSFVLQKDGTTIKTIYGSQFSGPDADGNYYYSIDGVENGNYTIKEVVSGENTVAYTRTTTVKIDGGNVVSGQQGALTFDRNQGATATIVNSYARNKGRLVLKKTLAGVKDADLAKAVAAVKFTITPSPTGSGTSKVYNLSEFTKNADGTYMLEILDVPTGNYVVKETVYDIEGYDTESVEYTLTTNSTTATVTDGKANGVSASVSTGAATTVSVVDTYKETVTSGKLIITKTIKGDVTEEEAKGALTFTVTNNADTTDTATYTLKDFKYDATTGKYTLELSQTAGGYTVEETTYDIAGKAVTVKYSVDGSAQVTGNTASATVAAGGRTQVDFENEYAQLVGGLKLTKSVTGADFDAVKDKISFKITGPNGYEKTVKGTEFDAATQSLTITGLAIGDYTIVETVEGVTGYKYVSTVNSTGTGSTSASVKVENNTTSELTFTNKYEAVETGKIVINKTIKGDITKEEAEGALEFTVTNNDTNETETYTLKDFTKNADGTYTLELDVNVGGYTVEETIYDVDGYITASVKYSVDGSDMTDDSKATVDVSKDQTVTVDFEDDYIKDEGKLVITKTIKGDVTKEEAEGALQFKVTDTATGKSKIYTLKDFTYDPATGTYTLELDLPSGSYTVEETIYDIKGYITSSVKYKVGTGEYAAGTSATAKVDPKGSINVDFEDVYEKNEGKLILTKSVKGDLIWDDVKDDLSFVVKNKTTGKSKTYKAADFTDPDGDGVYTLVIEGLEAGEYTVTEKLSDVKGYLLETIYRIDGGSKQVGTKAAVTLTKDGAQLDFVNTYTSTKGKLRITKTLLGNISRKDAEGVLKFKVTNVQTGKSKTYTLDDFTYDKKSEQYVLELTLEAGKYTVTETEYDVNGYELRSVTYKIDDGEKTEGSSAKIKVKAGKTTKLAFADRYIKKKTSDRTDTTQQTPPTTTTTTTDRDTPKTGDESPLMLWLAMLLFGACGTLGSVYGLRKNKKK